MAEIFFLLDSRAENVYGTSFFYFNNEIIEK